MAAAAALVVVSGRRGGRTDNGSRRVNNTRVAKRGNGAAVDESARRESCDHFGGNVFMLCVALRHWWLAPETRDALNDPES